MFGLKGDEACDLCWGPKAHERFVGGGQLIDSTLLMSGPNLYQLKMKCKNTRSFQKLIKRAFAESYDRCVEGARPC